MRQVERRAPMLFALPVLLLAVASALPVPASAQVAEGPVTFLVYHALGGPEPDTLATAFAPPPGNVTRLPVTTFDRVERASSSPENAPAESAAHFREFQRIVGLRESVPAPVVVTLAGALAPGQLEIDAQLEGAPDTRVRLELVVFEHDAAMYVARFAFAPIDVVLPADLSQQVRLEPHWDPEELGVVAIVTDAGTGEALQSATWLVRDDAPVTQTRRAVLVEHVTASWCEPCRPADDALALLAEQRGVAGGPVASGDAEYLRAPTWRLWLGLALGAAAGIALARRSTA